MVRENARVQHVRVGHHDMTRIPHRGPGGRRRIAIESIGAYSDFERFNCLGKFGNLILTQRLRWKQVQGAGVRFPEEPVQHRQIVT